jgi:hypothetical protein
MTRRLRRRLDTIEKWLADPKDSEGMHLAAILSALRGPDTDSEGYKTTTTVPIRVAAFPHLAEIAYKTNDVLATGFGQWYMDPKKPFEDTPVGLRNHFTQHAHDAALVLGLIPKSEYAV